MRTKLSRPFASTASAQGASKAVCQNGEKMGVRFCHLIYSNDGTASDRVQRLFVVTPDTQRVYHSIDSIDPHETISNYGFNLPW
tara:strand:+ start:93 stop:344 length:252 start_codon:yes stop_codon:yes gene_type:complete